MTERTTILIVDDESKIRRLLSRSLETEGFDVAVADSAMSASEFLKNGHCDLIILDYMMPEIDGMAFLAELRKKSSIPVIGRRLPRKPRRWNSEPTTMWSSLSRSKR